MSVRRLMAAGCAAVVFGAVVFAVAPARAADPPCYECHDDFPKKMKEFKFTHEPAASGDCTACHLDHGDAEKLMLVKNGAALCAECHDDVAKGTSVHAPVGDGECTSCHNPHGSANKKLLVAAGAALCKTCHDDMAQGATVHAPVADGDCSSCHKPHASANEKLLVAAGAALCQNCHDDMAQGASVHAPVKEGKCTACHNPHATAAKKLLVAAGTALCEKCHAGGTEFKRKVTHAAIDDCSACHRPHSSGNPRLFTKNFKLDRLALFDPKDAELCQDCHDIGGLTKLQSEDTGFRMGAQNLHATHLLGGGTPNKYGIVKKKEGQTCFACHLPHTADQARLLRTEYQCTGTFCYTMRFVPSEKGGTCVVGCHKPRVYSRDGQDPSSTAGAAPTAQPTAP